MEKQLVTTKLIAQICQKLNVPFSFATENKTVLQLHLKNCDHFMINSNLGLISSTKAQLCLDKAYQYEILNKVISQPKTISYLDPNSEYKNFAPFTDHQEIINDIKNNFSFPIIIKKNTGMEGVNIFLCKNEGELVKAVKTVFNQNDYRYDHVLLAQEYIEIKKEYRAVFYKHQLELLYRKDNSQATFTNNLSPLHYEGARAVEETNQELIKKIEQFVQPTFRNFDLIYGGYDIAEDQQGKLWLIEINSVPGFAYYLKDNGEEKIANLFKKIITDLTLNK